MKKLGAIKDQIWGDKGGDHGNNKQRHRNDHGNKQHQQQRHGNDHGNNDLREFSEDRRRQIESLKKRGQHEEADRLGRETRRIIEERRRHGEGDHNDHHERGHQEHNRHEGEQHDERVQHAMRAIEHLHAAGLHDIAEEIERRIHEHHHDGDEDEGRRDEMEDIHRQLDELRRAMHELTEHLGRRR